MKWKNMTEKQKKFLLYGGLVTVMSYFTYMHAYWYPNALFWDENYHIASAQKYIHDVFFMEPHPPLGKLLIALGEKMIHPNAASDQYLDTLLGSGDMLPEGFSFAGYRFFPALLGWLTAPVLYGIFFLITGNYLMATLLSFLYVFDNAMIVHFRGAMLDSTMLFFFCATIYGYLLMRVSANDEKKFCDTATIFGFCFACLVTTKANGLILLPLVPLLVWELRKHIKLLKKAFFGMSIAFLLTFVSVWSMHFALATQRNPELNKEGYFTAGEKYKQLIDEGKNWNPVHFPLMFSESIKYFADYQQGVPDLDICKDGELGSPAFMWPFGGRGINYRWESADEEKYRYLYLQSNPIVWWLALLGVVLSASLLISSVLLPLQQPLKNRIPLTVLLVLYLGYMGTMIHIPRVMYMYHYFPALVTGFMLFAYSLMEIQVIARRNLSESDRIYILLGCATAIVIGFQMYRPLTYYLEVTNEQFQRRNLLRIWDIKCVNCERNNGITIRAC